MKRLGVWFGCVACLIGAYAVAAQMHLIRPVDWLALAHLKKNDHLFHGSRVNAAKEDRSDVYWQQASAEVAKNPALLVTGAVRSPYPPNIEHGDTELPEIALTFDDGPHFPSAHALVQELKSLNLKATFFVVGKMAERHPELVREEAAAGDEIGNHSFSHVNLKEIPEKEIDIACNLLLKKILGYQPRLCRPPGGDSDPLVFQAAKANGLSTVMWTDDPLDYSNPGEDEILDRTLRHLSNGGILLLHEGVQETMSVLPLITKEIRDRGYKIVTVGQLMKDSAQARQGAIAQLTERPITQSR
jgi:peptidoglycan/xylan/chitin deacetylase (PgdA/CDA1 family)